MSVSGVYFFPFYGLGGSGLKNFMAVVGRPKSGARFMLKVYASGALTLGFLGFGIRF
jgi:hypothetical protein